MSVNTAVKRKSAICWNCKHFHFNKFGFVCKEERDSWLSEEQFNDTEAPKDCPMILELLVLRKEQK